MVSFQHLVINSHTEVQNSYFNSVDAAVNTHKRK